MAENLSISPELINLIEAAVAASGVPADAARPPLHFTRPVPKVIRRWCRSTLAAAVKRRDIRRPLECSECTAAPSDWPIVWTYGTVHGHHEDYARPLDVVWLCRPHHAQRHAAGGMSEVKARVLACALWNGHRTTGWARRDAVSPLFSVGYRLWTSTTSCEMITLGASDVSWTEAFDAVDLQGCAQLGPVRADLLKLEAARRDTRKRRGE